MSARRRSKVPPNPATTPDRPGACGGVLVFQHDRKRGIGVAVGNTLRTYRYAIARHPSRGWRVEVFALLRPDLPGGATEELLAAGHCRSIADAEAWCSRDFLFNR